MATSIPSDPESRPDDAPDLELVSQHQPEHRPEHEPAPAPAEDPPSETRGLPIWLFLLVFVLFTLALVWQVRETRQLEAEVAGLEQELDSTRALLGAHRNHLSEIRAGVHDLAGRLEGLRGLVDQDPGERPSPEPGIDPGDEVGATPTGDESHPIPSRLPQR